VIRNVVRVAEVLDLSVPRLTSVLDSGRSAWIERSQVIRGKLRPLQIARSDLRRVHDSILRRICSRFPVHPASYCERRRGALAAARVHARHAHFLHLDLKGFFPSVTRTRIEGVFSRAHFRPLEAQILAELVTCDNQLPQGASTSVALGNAVLYHLDARINTLCRKRGLSYTRYVDDLAVSGGSRLQRAEGLITRIVEDEGWTVAGKKGGLRGVNERHRYLGIVLNATPNIDRSYVKDLRFLISQHGREGRLSDSLINTLKGRLAYVTGVNPRLGRSLNLRLEAASESKG
jgi:hypothetical protein